MPFNPATARPVRPPAAAGPRKFNPATARPIQAGVGNEPALWRQAAVAIASAVPGTDGELGDWLRQHLPAESAPVSAADAGLALGTGLAQGATLLGADAPAGLVGLAQNSGDPGTAGLARAASAVLQPLAARAGQAREILQGWLPDTTQTALEQPIVGRDAQGDVVWDGSQWRMPNPAQVAHGIGISAPVSLPILKGAGVATEAATALGAGPRAAQMIGLGTANAGTNATLQYQQTYQQYRNEFVGQVLAAAAFHGTEPDPRAVAAADAKAHALASQVAGITMATSGLTGAASAGLANLPAAGTRTSAALRGGLSEGITEVPEEMQQAATADLLLGRDVRTGDVVEAGVMGFMPGAVQGAAFGLGEYQAGRAGNRGPTADDQRYVDNLMGGFRPPSAPQPVAGVLPGPPAPGWTADAEGNIVPPGTNPRPLAIAAQPGAGSNFVAGVDGSVTPVMGRAVMADAAVRPDPGPGPIIRDERAAPPPLQRFNPATARIVESNPTPPVVATGIAPGRGMVPVAAPAGPLPPEEPPEAPPPTPPAPPAPTAPQAGPVARAPWRPVETDFPETPDLTPEARALEATSRRWAAENADELVRRYRAHKDADGGKVISADIARDVMFDEFAPSKDERSRATQAMQAVSGAVANRLFQDAVAEPPSGPDAYAIFTGGGPGAGKSTSIRPGDPVREAADFIVDGTQRNFDGTVKAIQATLDSGREVQNFFTIRPIEEAWLAGLKRAMDEGRVVLAKNVATSTIDAAKSILRQIGHFGSEPRYRPRVAYNERGKARPGTIADLERIAALDPKEVERELVEIARREHAAGRISDTVLAESIRGSGQGSGASRPDAAARPGQLPEGRSGEPQARAGVEAEGRGGRDLAPPPPEAPPPAPTETPTETPAPAGVSALGPDLISPEERARYIRHLDEAPSGSRALINGTTWVKGHRQWTENDAVAPRRRSSSGMVDAGVRGYRKPPDEPAVGVDPNPPAPPADQPPPAGTTADAGIVAPEAPSAQPAASSEPGPIPPSARHVITQMGSAATVVLDARQGAKADTRIRIPAIVDGRATDVEIPARRALARAAAQVEVLAKLLRCVRG